MALHSSGSLASDSKGGGALQTESVDARAMRALEKKVALLLDKLANAEDEFAALYSKSLKNDAREQERALRHHKAVGQLQKKVLAEAEIKRTLQRKLDERAGNTVIEKEAMWNIERDRLQAQVRSMEEQKKAMLEELDRSSLQLRKFETSLLDMNASMQELQQSAAQWKLKAEKRKAQVSDAISAQRSSDSRVVVLEAELKRRRDEQKALLQKLPVPTPSAEMQTQTEKAAPLEQQEGRRREFEQWRYLMQYLLQVCSETALAVESTAELGNSLNKKQTSDPSCPVPLKTADAMVGTDALVARHISVETDAAAAVNSVHAQTDKEVPPAPPARTDSAMQTVVEARVIRYHVDSQVLQYANSQFYTVIPANRAISRRFAGMTVYIGYHTSTREYHQRPTLQRPT